MPTRPEDLHPELSTAFNAGDLEGVLALYDPEAAFVIKPGRVTDGPEELRAVLRKILDRGGHLTVRPHTFVRSNEVVLVLGRYTLSGRQPDGIPHEFESGFADVLRQQPDGSWRIAVDNGYAS